MYHLFTVNQQTGKRRLLTETPRTWREAIVMKGHLIDLYAKKPIIVEIVAE